MLIPLKEDNNMMKKMKKMKKTTMIVIAMVLVLATASTATIAVLNWSSAATTKPAQVKNLKKVKLSYKWDGHSNVNTAKIKFSKVKGATGYQVLVYRTNRLSATKTPLVFSYNTKKSTYTVKNLIPAVKYTIKVRAYKKDKNGKVVYGKAKSLKITTPGEKKGWYNTCNTCGACMPDNDNLLAKHIKDVYKMHREVHAGYSYYKR